MSFVKYLGLHVLNGRWLALGKRGVISDSEWESEFVYRN